MANVIIPVIDMEGDPIDVIVRRARNLATALYVHRAIDGVWLSNAVEQELGLLNHAFSRIGERPSEKHPGPDVPVHPKRPDRFAEDVRADPPRDESGSSPAAAERGATRHTLAWPGHSQAGCMTIWQTYKAFAAAGYLACPNVDLDPARLAKAATRIADELIQTDPV